MGYCFGCFTELERAGVCPRCGYDPGEDIGKYPMALPQGSILKERYIVGRVLGQGGFGITYAALDFETQELMAIKEYLPGHLASRDGSGTVTSHGGQTTAEFLRGKEGFLDEANTLAQFSNNPHIVNISDYFEENGTAYFVMDFVRGRNLKSFVKVMGGRLGQEEANRILLPIMEALGDVHAKGLVHRDIAPDNIIVTAEGSAKLIDFGAARYSTGEKSMSLDVILKHGYAPVEQYSRHSRQGAYTDVYAMAATYYYAVTGAVPSDSVSRVAGEQITPPSQLGAKLEENTENALLKALSMEPEDRYKSMGDFARALRGETAAPPPKKQQSPKNHSGKKPARKPFIIAAAAIMLLALIVGGFFLFREPESKEPWSFDEESGTLTVRGEGAMEDIIPGYSSEAVPWEELKESITALVIKDGVTSIGERAFSGCKNLLSAQLPASLKEIGVHAFYECKKLRLNALPEGLEHIGVCAFYFCESIEEIQLPSTLTEIGKHAFDRCRGLRSIVIPEGITEIQEACFYDCSALVELTLPGTVKTIGESAFASCDRLPKLVIPEGVTLIEMYAFEDCAQIKEVWLPLSLEKFAGSAFIECDGIDSLYYAGSETDWFRMDRGRLNEPLLKAERYYNS